jgi:hypothetical protein
MDTSTSVRARLGNTGFYHDGRGTVLATLAARTAHTALGDITSLVSDSTEVL